MGSDRAIASAAWTSSSSLAGKEKKTDAQVDELVARLARDGHSTPFEYVDFVFWIRLPIFTDRQHMTHRIASHNGLSGRYRTMPKDFFSMPNDVRGILQSAGNDIIAKEYRELCEDATDSYSVWLEDLKSAQAEGTITNDQYKRAREVLRGVLPTSGMTERMTKMNLRSFANYQRLRNSDHAQPEIRRVAELMLAEVEAKNIAPVALRTLKELGWRI